MLDHAMTGGFADASLDAARCFRAAMNAMARPGTVYAMSGAVGPAPLSGAAAALILTLCDADTPIHLASDHDGEAIRRWIAFHTGAPVVAAEQARFALGRWDALLPLGTYPLGSAEYPDRSATLIVEMAALTQDGARLTGPGIETEARLLLPDVAAFQGNAAHYPQGLDFYFTTGDSLAALPRSTKVETT